MIQNLAGSNNGVKLRDRELQFDFIRDINDSRIGASSLLRLPDNNIFIVQKSTRFENNAIAAKKLQILLDLLVSDHNTSIVPIVDYEVLSNKYSPVENYLVNYFAVYPEIDLKRQQDENIKHSIFFTSEELTYLLYGGATSLAYLQQKSLYHGNLSPKFIMITKSGYSIYFDPADNRYPPSHESRNHKSIYYSPEAYTCSFSGGSKPFNRLKDDVYSLGLIILECGTQDDVRKIYDPNQPVINQTELTRMIEKFEMRYRDNVTLISVVKKILEMKEVDRPDPESLLSKLPNFAEVQEYFETNKESKQQPVDTIYPPSSKNLRESDLPALNEKEDEKTYSVQHDANFKPKSINFYYNYQTHDTQKNLSMKSPNRLQDQKDRLSEQYRKAKLPKVEQKASKAHFLPGRVPEFYMTPGGNIMKKEHNYYETTDENGQKKYEIHVEYNLLPKNEADLLFDHYDELKMYQVRDKDFNVQFQPKAEPTFVVPNQTTFNTEEHRKLADPEYGNRTRGYQPYYPPVPMVQGPPLPTYYDKKDYFNSQSTRHNFPHLSNEYEPQTHGSHLVQHERIGNLPQFEDQRQAELAKQIGLTKEKQRYMLDGHYYDGYIDLGPNEVQYLVVDTDQFKMIPHNQPTQFDPNRVNYLQM